MKIVGFRLALRAKEISRRAKKAKADLAAAWAGEPELESWLALGAKSLRPAVLFATFPHPDADQALLSPLPGLAYSLVILTLGGAFDDWQARTLAENPASGPVWPLLRDAALDEARRFATGLISDEAAKDSCELSPLSALGDGEPLAAALRKLDGSKIGVSLAEGALSPRASEAFSVSWLSKSKARNKKS